MTLQVGSWTLSFLPYVPWPLFWLIAAVGALAVGAMLYGRMRGALLRALTLVLLLGALANPQLAQDEREKLSDIAAVVVDDSDSQGFGQRQAQTDKALEELRQRVAALGNTELRVGRTVTGTTPDTDGTRVLAALSRITADIPPDRYAGAIIISDGQIHDVPGAADIGKLKGPIHTLLSGSKSEIDRRVVIEQAPRFAITGQSHEVRFRVSETPAGTDPVDIAIRLPNGDVQNTAVAPNETQAIVVPIDRAGQNIVEISAAERPGEITTVNNRAMAVIDGIRDRLRVLLISGEPHPGERTWRNMLKADASVDLVHFTILRPPEKQDGTPTKELSLIAFPTRELFLEKLDQFDLVIFDRYQRQSILPDSYLANVADYVRKGGAVLVSSGPDFASGDGLASTPLADVLAAIPTGEVTQEPFKPQVTLLGERHPVSRGLPGDAPDEPKWGRWFRLIDTSTQNNAQELMSGPGSKPLLALARVDNGRVAQFLSDQGWLWARGFEGGGPQLELLRRISHWLMKEPDLEEEALRAHQDGRNLVIERQTLADAANPVEVTTPSGKVSQVPMKQGRPGVFTAAIPAAETGLYVLKDGTLTAFAVTGTADQKEFADVRATGALMQPVAASTGGSIAWLEDGMPRLSKANVGALASGSGWMALTDNQQFRVLAVRETPLFSTLLSLAVLLAGLSFMWYREGR
ncbi:hypothetical protein [Aestuariivirga sp.]|uniref:hypothetical protein n=1 Tax=Aestuariivirga sp. TaxID=2650926 RepID=UPI0039E29351